MSANPYESSSSEGIPAPTVLWKWLLKAAVVVGVLFILLLMLVPMRRGVGPAARRNGCLNNMRNIALALNQYESVHGTFPPAYTVDSDGNRLHSWRTLILPFLEERALFESIDLTKPWDDPANEHARNAQLSVYICPSTSHASELTTYLAVVGPGFAFDGHEPKSIKDVNDPSQTACIVDADSTQAVHWMSPEDTDERTLLSLTQDSLSNHNGVIVVAYLDAHTLTLNLDLSRDELRPAELVVD